MSAPGVGFSRLIRVAGPPLVDPATKALTAYWATRGDASDYQTGTGTWAGRASAGSSGGVNLTQPTAGSRPVTTTVDGKAIVRKTFADGRTFLSPGTMSAFRTATATAGIIIARIPATLNNNYGLGSGYPTPAYLNDSSSFQGAGAGRSTTNPATVTAGVGRYDGVSWKVSQNDLIPSSVLVALCWRHAGGQLQHAVNAAPGAGNQTACGACTGSGAAAFNFLANSSLEADYAAYYEANALTDTDFTDIIAWERAQFPTGFP